MGQGGDLINLHINCPNIRDIPNDQIPLQKVGGYWGFDTCSVTVQYTETVAILKVSSEVIKCPTIGAASFGLSRKFWSGENFGPGEQNSRKIWSAGLLFSENIGPRVE